MEEQIACFFEVDRALSAKAKALRLPDGFDGRSDASRIDRWRGPRQ
jgi:hypothetical protein